MPPNLGPMAEVFSEEGTCIFAFREPPQIIFQGDTSTQSERTRPNFMKKKANTTYGRNRSTQASGIIIHRPGLKLFHTRLKVRQ